MKRRTKWPWNETAKAAQFNEFTSPNEPLSR